MFEIAAADTGPVDLLAELSSTLQRVQRIADIAKTREAPPAAGKVSHALAQAVDLLTMAYSSVGSFPGGPRSLAKGGLAGWQVRALRQYIADHLEERIKIGDLAEVARISGSYLCRAFQVTFGCSPMEYLRNERIEAAKARLRSTEHSLSDIACACGFADQPHFTRTFRTQVGMTPRAWRMAWMERSIQVAAPVGGIRAGNLASLAA